MTRSARDIRWDSGEVPARLVAFAGLAAVLVAVPGPAVLLVLKSAVARGRGAAVVTACGVFAADLVWATASVVGLTALLVSSQVAFDVVRFAGAGYLIYLGLRLLLSRHDGALAPAEPAAVDRRIGVRTSFAQGLLCDLSNPKTVIVFASVIPQFLGTGSGAADAFVLGLVFAVCGFASLLCYGLLFGTASARLRNARFTRRLMQACGGVLTAFGVGLLVERPATS